MLSFDLHSPFIVSNGIIIFVEHSMVNRVADISSVLQQEQILSACTFTQAVHLSFSLLFQHGTLYELYRALAGE